MSTSHFSEEWCSKEVKEDKAVKEDGEEVATVQTAGKLVPQVVKFASRGQCGKMIQALEEMGEGVNCVDGSQRSALFYAALNGHKKCVKELLRRGADPNQADKEGLTPCHAVALGGRIPRPKNTNNSTAGLDLLCSDLCQCLDGVCSFLPHNLADSCSRKRCLEYLVQYGGDLKTSTYGGKESTKDIAERCGKSSVVRMINEYYTLQADRNDTAEMMFCPTKSTLWMHSTSSTVSQPATQQEAQGPRVPREWGSGETGEIKEVNPTDIVKVPAFKDQKTIDGSVWSRGVWTEGVHVTLRQIPGRGRRGSGEGAAVLSAELLLREMDNLRDMRHPQLTLLMAVCCGPRQQDMFLALEPLQAGSLYKLMHKDHRRFSRLQAVGIVGDITRAIVYLHNTEGVAHSILSSHAVYLSPAGVGKLCNVYCCQPTGTRLPALYSPALRLFLPWMAPELMQTRITALASDIFSLGVLLWEVWSGRAPWPGLSPPQLGRVLVQTGQRLPLTNQHCLIAPILKTCFGAPATRLPAAQLLSQINYVKLTQYKA